MTVVRVRSGDGNSPPSAVLPAEAAALIRMCPGLDSWRTTSDSLSGRPSLVGVSLSSGWLAVRSRLTFRSLSRASSFSRTSLGVRLNLCIRAAWYVRGIVQ